MMPTYRTMDSHPYHRNQMPFPHYYHPGYEPIHPQMKMDPSEPPVVHEQSWPPYAAGYSYPAPVHFCCGHNSFPGYCGFRPAYPHVPSPSPMYYPGRCPAYPDPYSIPCTPPPHYTMEIPRYEYDKYMPREYQYHCCGCPNHPCHQKEGSKSVKIEEQEHEVEKNVNDALVPAESRNYRYPFVWIPPEYMNNQEQKKPIAADMGGLDKITRDAKHPEYSKAGGREKPRVCNGWFPFDMNSLPNMILDRDGRINQNLQSETNRKESEDGRKNNQEATSSTSSPKSVEEVPQNHIYKSFPVNIIAGEKAAKGTNSEEESTNMGGSNVTEKANKEKSIPVKQMELHQGNDDSENGGRRVRNIPVKQMKENMAEADKESKTNVKIESTTPHKTSKLPPVCLRVDPLPRKSNGNGSSRFPSPPASREHSQTTVGGTSKSSSSAGSEKALPDSKLQNASDAIEISKNSSSSTTSEKALLDSKLQNVSNASEKVQPKKKIIEVLEEKTNGNEDENQMRGPKSSSGPSMRKESYANGDEWTEENKAERKEEPVVEEKATGGRGVGDSNKTDDQSKMKKKVLSGVEAAVLIQAAYRGFQVRKWEPLKKLKQISEVSKQVTEVSDHIRAIEASCDLQNDDRLRLTVGETIMRLLLKLDTIQGLHPSYREIRKSLVRELTSLQEKLDSMMSKKSEQHMQDPSATKPIEDVHWSLQDGKHACERQEEQIAASAKDSESTNQEHHDILEICQDQISVEDFISNIKPEEKLPADGSRESWPPVSPIYNNNEAKPVAQQNEITNGDDVQVETVDESNSENGFTEMENMAVEKTLKPGVKGTPIEADDFAVTSLKELPRVIYEQPVNLDSGKNMKAELGRRFEPQQTGGITMVMDDYSAQHGEVSEIDAIKELPVGILDEDPQHGEASEIDAIKELPGGILDEDPMMAQSEKQETECKPSNEAMQELPVGLLDEEQKSSEHEKCEKSGTSKEAIAELPVGFVMLSSEFEKLEQTETSKQAMAELPVGLLDEDMTGSELEEHKENKTYHEVLVAKEEEHEETAQMTASTDSTPSKNQSEQQQQMLLDDQAEVQSTETEESDGWVKVGSQKDDKHHDASSESAESEFHLEEGVHGDNEQATYQSVPSLSEVPENGNMIAEQVIGADTDDREIMARKKDEQHDGGVNNDKKLIKENKKLREMMKKLLDAGNEQLNVISDLTDRVKDLEKKLAKKRRLRTKGFRPGTRRPTCLKS